MHYEDDSTSVDLVPNSGSSADMNDGDTHVQDIKGYPFGSPFTDGTTTIDVGLGVLVGTAPAVVVTELEEGAVILTIERISDAPGSAIKVTWALNPEFTTGSETVDIYYATGDGTGQYPTDFTQMVVEDDSVLSLAGVTPDGGTAFQWANQVGAGDPELYFKGCLHAQASASGPSGLAGNVGVGKVNVSLQGEPANQGKNLISVPFLAPSPLIKEVYGDGPDSVWAEGDMIQYKFAPSPAYKSAVYVGNTWKNGSNTAQDPPFEADHRFGNWIITKGDKDITLVGKVLNINVPIAIYDGAGLSTGGKTFLGMVYPVSFGLTSTSLIADGAQDGDMVQYKTAPLAEAYISAVVVGGSWKNGSNTAAPINDKIATFKVPNSYIYVRYGDAGFTWNRVKP
jgi:hypothetical protein